MYKITKIQENNLNYIEIVGVNNVSKAKICLDRGAALEELTLNNIPVILDLKPLEYKNTYASAILFPFANRIKDGKYSYKGVDYKFECNEANLNNALHGLVHHKLFAVIDSEVYDDEASITLAYTETSRTKGFPFLYTIGLKYILTSRGIDLQITVENNDSITFPFTLGWHPYFLSDDLYNSSLSFEGDKIISFDERMITEKVLEEKVTVPIEIKDQQLDHCYGLENKKGTVLFKTPKFEMTITSTEEENYFQMYTPPKANTIALEPVTGISDSFNNKIGLKELSAGDKYEIIWTVNI